MIPSIDVLGIGSNQLPKQMIVTGAAVCCMVLCVFPQFLSAVTECALQLLLPPAGLRASSV
jgi:hypothetical protein